MTVRHINDLASWGYAVKTPIDDLRANGYGSADFEVKLRALMYYSEEYPTYNTDLNLCSKSVLYRTDTGEELGVHGNNYVPVQPRALINNTRNIIERSDLDITGITEQITTSHNGSRLFVKYDLPAHTYETCDGDKASLSLLCTTSYDQTWPFMISVAATQHACTNLQVFITGGIGIYKAKHTKSLNIEHGANLICKSLDIFNNERELWIKLGRTIVTNDKVWDLFVKATNSKLKFDYKMPTYPQDNLNKLKRKNHNLEYVWNVYKNKYKPTLGSNLWSVYNALTDWSTHANATTSRGKANIASIRNDRQNSVRKTFTKYLEVA